MPTVTIADPAAPVTEGGMLSFTLTRTGDVLGTLAYEPASRPTVTEQRQPSFTVGGRPASPFNADDLDIPAFLRDRR